MPKTTLTARAERSGKWWAVSVPEMEGLFTQARRLDQIPAMVSDAAALLTDQPEDSFKVEVVPIVPAAVSEHLDAARRLFNQAKAAQHAAAEESRLAARELVNAGLTMRDVGQVLGVSHQRAHQLLA